MNRATSPYLNRPVRSLTEALADQLANAFYSGGFQYAEAMAGRIAAELELPGAMCKRIAEQYAAILSRKH